MCLFALLSAWTVACTPGENHITCYMTASYNGEVIHFLNHEPSHGEDGTASEAEAIVKDSIFYACAPYSEKHCPSESDPKHSECLKTNMDACESAAKIEAALCRDDWGDGKELYKMGDQSLIVIDE